MKLLIVLMLVAAISACSISPPKESVSYQNRPTREDDFFSPSLGAVPRAKQSSDQQQPHFIGIALSGGGSRAANFSAAVLEQLDNIGILREVDVISSVSGGGLTAAYYALHAEDPQWPVLRKKLRTDFFSIWERECLMPPNLFALLFSDRDKTDVLADVFDETLFDHAKYSALKPNGPRFLANATDLTGGGHRFVFSDEKIRGELHSSLADIRISNAVAASGALPGIFDSLTLQRYRPDEIVPSSYSPSRSWEQPSYVHLVDGGLSDNLGIETLIESAFYSLYGEGHQEMPVEFPHKPCLIIAVDSNTPNTASETEYLTDTRSTFDRFFNKNVFDGIDALFDARRRETLAKLGLAQSEFDEYAYVGLGNFSEELYPYQRVTKFKVPVLCRPFFGVYKCEVDYAKPMGTAKELSFSCMVWHIPLEQVSSVRFNDKNNQLSYSEENSLRRSYATLRHIVSQTKTRYSLVGPKGCRPEFIQEALYDAARVLVLDDEKSRFELCRWFFDNGLLINQDACRKRVPPTVKYYPVKPLLPYGTHKVNTYGKPANDPVRCDME